MDLIFTACTQSLLFFPLVLGIYLSYGIFRTTDMTVDGSFVIGAGVFARLVTSNCPQSLSLLLAVAAGSLAGIGVSIIQFKNKIEPLLAGILALFMLYSINPQLMGRPNISLLEQPSLAESLHLSNNLIVIGAIVLAVTLLLIYLLHTQYGLGLRAFGSHSQLLQRLGQSIEFYRFSGFALSNGLVALCGALTAEVNGYADIGMGAGMTLTGIGAVVIGRQLLKSLYRYCHFHLLLDLVSCAVGTLLYFFAINLFLALGINPINLKLILGIVLVVFLMTSRRTK